MAFYQVMMSENPGLWWLTPLSTYFSYIVVRKSKMTSTVEYNFQFTISLYGKITNVFSKLSKLIKPNSAWMVIAICHMQSMYILAYIGNQRWPLLSGIF
jgi:hypothetical protein